MTTTRHDTTRHDDASPVLHIYDDEMIANTQLILLSSIYKYSLIFHITILS